MAVAPTLVVRYTTDDASDATPSWTDVTSYVRSFSTSRGRESELSRVDAGTATIVLNNRTRQWDPVLTAALRPMNRWNIRATLPDATTKDVFLGYAESYEQQWPATGKDAITVVRCADEFKLLAQDALQATDPPRDNYQDLVNYDTPSAYWPLGLDLSNSTLVAPVAGPQFTVAGGTIGGGGSVFGDGATVGSEPVGYTYVARDQYYRTAPVGAGDELDPGGLAEIGVEIWFRGDTTAPAASENLFRGPTAGASTWSLEFRTDRKIDAVFRNSASTVHTVTSTTALTLGTWYHIVAAISGGNLRIYINGTQEASTAWAGAFAAVSTASVVTLGNNGTDIGASRIRSFDEVAFYRYGLTAARVLAHFTAGRNRGFARASLPGDRIDDVLDASSSVAARSIQAGTNIMTGAYEVAQPPLDEMRKAESAEGVDAVLFIANDGTITFLADGHRSSAPYNTVQATFDDDGTDLPYQDLVDDYSDSFIANEWNVTKTGGTTTTASDATSIGLYGKRTQSLTDLPITSDADVTAIAAAMLAKYKDPMFRITTLQLVTKTNALMNAVFPLDIGARIRVFRTQPGGGARIDQTLFVQRISVDGEPGRPWRITLAVSPL